MKPEGLKLHGLKLAMQVCHPVVQGGWGADPAQPVPLLALLGRTPDG